jgi:hypothetical protein
MLHAIPARTNWYVRTYTCTTGGRQAGSGWQSFTHFVRLPLLMLQPTTDRRRKLGWMEGSQAEAERIQQRFTSMKAHDDYMFGFQCFLYTHYCHSGTDDLLCRGTDRWQCPPSDCHGTCQLYAPSKSCS